MVYYPDFESGLYKIASGEINRMIAAEMEANQSLKLLPEVNNNKDCEMKIYSFP